MSTLRFNAPAVAFNGLDLTGFVKDALDIPLDPPWQERLLADLPDASLRFDGWLQPRRMTWTCSWDDLHPDTQAYFLRLMAEARARRLSRMRSAYRKRAKRR